VVLLAAVIFVAITWAAQSIPGGSDWYGTWRPAFDVMLRGQNPYDVVPRLATPPWVMILLFPLAALPSTLGRGALFAVSLLGFTFAALRFQAKPAALGGFLLSPLIFHSLLNGNTDWLVLIGATLPPPVGMILVMSKPQVGLGLAVFWAAWAYREGGLRGVARVVAPVLVVTLVSFVIFGFWPTRAAAVLGHSADINASLWPWTIPLGVGLLAYGLYRRHQNAALASSPFLSPYVLFHAYCGAQAALLRRPAWVWAVTLALWALVILRGVQGA
jgi:hypothetical protein